MISGNHTLLHRKPTAEEELLFYLLRTEMNQETTARIEALLQEKIDWDQLRDLAIDHKVVALLPRHLDKFHATPIPESFRKELKAQLQIHAQGNLFLTKELLDILNLFAQQQIAVIPYKGPVLAKAVYDDLMLRPFNDLDILIHEADVVGAMELLKRQGYQLLRPLWLAQLPEAQQTDHVRKLVAGSSWAYQLVMTHAQRKIVVELHWRVVPRYTFAAHCDELWENLQTVSIAGSQVATFSPENLLWFLCLHGSKHQWERLSWVCDIAQLLHTYPALDWQWLIAYARQKGISRRLYLGLLLAHKLFDAPLPTVIQSELAQNPVVNTLANSAIEIIMDNSDTDESDTGFTPAQMSGMPFQLRSMDRSVDRVRYVTSMLGLLLAPTAEDRNLLRLPAFFSPLYYLIRPLRLAFRLLGFSSKE